MAKGKHKQPMVFSVRSHFNMFRSLNEAHTGPVTVEEQIKGLERFIRWHERQVEVGRGMLAQLRQPEVLSATESDKEQPCP